ncbi:hypothetical protein BSKO_11523 [Bryopsis sp. KO-2023]|nr:hypothetical protein BSKO_11523 [Bryopsis sp. KO-2023]
MDHGGVVSERRKNFDLLRPRLEEIVRLKSFQVLDDWDQFVNMPQEAGASRGKRSSALAGVIHEKETDPRLGELLKSLDLDGESGEELSVQELAVLREAKIGYRLATTLNKELKAREAELATRSQGAWRNAKSQNDFGLFAPFLQEWVDLKREIAKSVDPEQPMYDVLLDEFERGTTCANLNKAIAKIKPVIVDLVSRIRTATQDPATFEKFDLTRFDGCYDLDEQEKLGKKLALALGFKGLVNIGPHPYTSDIGPTDVRITTR